LFVDASALAYDRPEPRPILEDLAVTAVRRPRIAVAVIFTVHGAVTGSFATRIPWIANRLDTDAGGLGFALFFVAVGALLAMPFAGRITHRFRSRPVARWLMVGWCLALIPTAFATSLPLLCVALLVYGATSGLADVAMNAQGVAVEQQAGRSIMSGLHGMWSMGGLIGSGFGVLAAHAALDARIHFAVAAAALSAIAIVAARFLLDITPPDEGAPLFALPPRRVVLIALVGFAAVFAEGASADWAAYYLTDITHAAPALAAGAFSGFAATMAVARLAGDRVVDRFGPVWTVRVGGVLATIGALTVALARVPWLAIVGFALVGLGVAVVVPLAFTAAGNAGPHPGQQIAGVATIAYGAGLIAPASIGGIADVSSLSVSFVVVAVLAALIVVGATTMRRRTSPSSTPDGPPGSPPPGSPPGIPAGRASVESGEHHVPAV
jgi:MFS family permease